MTLSHNAKQEETLSFHINHHQSKKEGGLGEPWFPPIDTRKLSQPTNTLRQIKQIKMYDVLSVLYHGDCDSSSLPYVFKVLSRACHDPLKAWGSSIVNTHKDPAIALLHNLVLEDKTSILVNISILFDKGVSHPAFHDLEIFAPGEEFREMMNSREVASYIQSQNEEFDEEGLPSQFKSTALFLWARWLEGDREVEDRLMHAIASRFWRISGEHTRNFIRGIALYAHAFLFYSMGWNPDTKVLDLPASKIDFRCYFAGREIPLTSVNDLTSDLVEQQVGSLLFNCVPRVPMSVCEKAGYTLDESRTLCPVKQVCLPIGSFGDDGIGVMGQLGNQTTVYFLHYPEEYEEGAFMVWELMDRIY